MPLTSKYKILHGKCCDRRNQIPLSNQETGPTLRYFRKKPLQYFFMIKQRILVHQAYEIQIVNNKLKQVYQDVLGTFDFKVFPVSLGMTGRIETG